MALPAYEPMQAVTDGLPDDAHGTWGYEIKWDGMRVIATVQDDALRLRTRSGLDATARFPEVAELATHLGGHRAVLDGEIVAFDDAGRADFQRLQPRMHQDDPAKVAELRRSTPVSLVVFDLLHLDDHPTIDVAYRDRRRLLVDLVEPAPGWSVPGHHVGDGAALFEQARRQGLEGVMAKQLDSRYQPGRRSSAWRKCKVRNRQEVVVGGWTTGEGHRSGTFGSLLVGVHDEPGHHLRFAGGVGTGFDDPTLRQLTALLDGLSTPDCPFASRPDLPSGRRAHWVRPEVVIEVEFAEWSADGRLRHPAYLGRREDKDPSLVVREAPPAPGPRPRPDGTTPTMRAL